MRWLDHVACMGKMTNAYRILVGKGGRKRSFGKHRHRWEGNMTSDLKRNSLGRCILDSSGQDRDE
jgi:hypothetical protein